MSSILSVLTATERAALGRKLASADRAATRAYALHGTGGGMARDITRLRYEVTPREPYAPQPEAARNWPWS